MCIALYTLAYSISKDPERGFSQGTGFPGHEVHSTMRKLSVFVCNKNHLFIKTEYLDTLLSSFPKSFL